MQGKTDANVPQDSLTQEGSVPFFTRFLEGQNNGNLQAADGNQKELRTTLKYPSDRDEIDFR
jgi:hypothetical protein